MALYKRSDFAKLCGVSNAHVSIYVKRGKLIMRGEYIDDSIRENVEMRDKWLESKAIKEAEAAITSAKISTIPPLQEKKQTKESKAKPKGRLIGASQNPHQRKKSDDLYIPEAKGKRLQAPEVPKQNSNLQESTGLMLDKEKKRAEINFKNAQTRIAELKESKLRGESIPTAMVADVISMLSHSFQSAYKNGAHQLLIEIAQKLKMSTDNEAHFNGLFIELINKAHKTAISEARKTIKTIISEIAKIEVDLNEEEIE